MSLINNICDYNNLKVGNIEKITEIEEEDSVLDFELIEDERLLVGFSGSIIKIYNSKTFSLLSSQKIFNKHYNIYHIHQLKNGNILITIYDRFYLNIPILKINFDNTINIIKEIQGNIYMIYNVIELKNQNLVSISIDKTIRFWDMKNYQQINLIEEDDYIYDILEIKNNIIAYDCGNSINFFDINKNDKINKIKNIENNNYPTVKFCLINENILLYGSDKLIYIFNIDKYELINTIIIEETEIFFHKLSENIFLIGNFEGNIIQYKYKNKNIEKISVKIKAHQKNISCLYNLNNGIILSGDWDGFLNIWK